MKTLRSRLLRHLSFANLVACLALFVALGGVGYAAATINGNAIVKQTIGAGKLKNGTLTSTQVKSDGLTGSVIQESTLGTVPSAQTAVSAQTAASATTAGTAQSAASATTAETAEEAHLAGDAETLDGLSAEQLQVTCPADTELFGGVCWDEDVRQLKTWIGASIECGEAGGRLPSLSELIAYVAQDGIQVSAHNWSADVVDLPSGKELVLTRDETSTATSQSSPDFFGFRCVFYRVN